MRVTTVSRRLAAAVVGALALALLPLAPASATGDSITLTGITAGEYLPSGSTAVIGADAATTDSALSVDLYVDNVRADTQPCVPGGTTCSVTFADLPAVLVDGTHRAEVRLTTDLGADVAQQTVTFFVGDAPTVAITAPPGGTFTGSVDVTASGVTDPDGTDYPASLELFWGATSIGAWTDCTTTPTPCEHTFTWDISAETPGDKTLTVVLTTHDGTQVTSAPVTVKVGTPPAISITAPGEGDTVVPNPSTGIVPVTITSGNDPDLDPLTKEISLFVDGADTAADMATCLGDVPCTPTLDWDATGLLPGTVHTLVAQVVAGGVTTRTVDRSVRIADLPTISITVPGEGGTVVPTMGTGIVPVTITADTDVALGALAKQLSLFVDDAVIAEATETCAADEVPCTKTLAWNATGLAVGEHTLVAKVVAAGVAGTSTTRTVLIAAPPTVTITSPASNLVVVPSPSGIVTVTATGTSDTGLGSVVKTFDLLIDGALTASSTTTCTSVGPCASPVSLTWNASSAAAGSPHTAVLRVTVRGIPATASVPFTLAADPTVTVVPPSGGTLAGATSVTVTAQSDAAAGEQPQSVVLTATSAAGAATVTLTAAQCDSPPSAGACTFTLPWDVSSLTGSYTLSARLTTTAARVRTSAAVTVTMANPAPTVTVTAPGATVLKGRVTVSAAASVPPQLTGRITTIALYAGATQIGATTACSTSSCSITEVWDTTLLPDGAVTILARATMSTTGGQQFDSAGVTVTLRNPVPSVTWISPSSSAVVSGSAVALKVRLGTDASQSDLPKSAAIYRNGSATPFDTFTCAGTSHSCTATFTWNATRAAGRSTFVVKVRTTLARVGLSSTTAPRALYASSGARITFLASTTVDNGTRVTLTGRMVAVRTGLGVPNARVVLVRDPALGSTVRTTVRTSSTGRFTLTYPATSNTTVTATSLALRNPSGSIWMPAATSSAGQQVRAPMTCRVANPVVSPGQKGAGSCSVPGLPAGTPLVLRFNLAGRWSTLAQGTNRAQTIPFSYVFPAKGSYLLRVILSGNAAYAGTNSVLMPVSVR